MSTQDDRIVTSGYFTSRDGARLHYLLQGKTDALTLLGFNGIGCSYGFWKYIARGLRDEYRILLWDYPGHGLSERPRDWASLSMENLAATAMDLLDHLDIAHALLMGHSMGVQIVLEAAHRFTERVRGLVLICGAYGHPLRHFLHSPLLDYLFPIPYALGTQLPFHDLTRKAWRLMLTNDLSRPIARLVGVHPHLAGEEDMNEYFAHLAAMDPEVFLRMARYMKEHTAEPYLTSIRAPALIVAGMEDHFTPYWISLRMYERLPHSRLLTIPEGSHVSHIEMPRLVVRTLRTFLEEDVLGRKPPECPEQQTADSTAATTEPPPIPVPQASPETAVD
jgi:pimeloyl-ACP methyl ester carboxylesterase